MKKMIMMFTVISSGMVYSSESFAKNEQEFTRAIREVESEPVFQNPLPRPTNLQKPTTVAGAVGTRAASFEDIPMVVSRNDSVVDLKKVDSNQPVSSK